MARRYRVSRCAAIQQAVSVSMVSAERQSLAASRASMLLWQADRDVRPWPEATDIASHHFGGDRSNSGHAERAVQMTRLT
jgi:hypothetical protein